MKAETLKQHVITPIITTTSSSYAFTNPDTHLLELLVQHVLYVPHGYVVLLRQLGQLGQLHTRAGLSGRSARRWMWHFAFEKNHHQPLNVVTKVKMEKWIHFFSNIGWHCCPLRTHTHTRTHMSLSAPASSFGKVSAIALSFSSSVRLCSPRKAFTSPSDNIGQAEASVSAERAWRSSNSGMSGMKMPLVLIDCTGFTTYIE